jgi:hypothetical protein
VSAASFLLPQILPCGANDCAVAQADPLSVA